MRLGLVRFVSGTTAAAVLSLSMQSFAQGYLPPPQQQQAPPPPPSANAPNGEYVAPMQQQTQQTYVPQSVAMSGPRVIKDWNEGEPIPPGYHPSSRVRGGLIGGGAGLFGAVYLLFGLLPAAIGSDVCDVGGCKNTLWPLYLPVVGPFITIGTVHNPGATGGIFLALDGLAQAGGVAMIIIGAIGRTVLVRNDLGEAPNNPLEFKVGKNMTGELTPLMGMGASRTATGAGLSLSF